MFVVKTDCFDFFWILLFIAVEFELAARTLSRNWLVWTRSLARHSEKISILRLSILFVHGSLGETWVILFFVSRNLTTTWREKQLLRSGIELQSPREDLQQPTTTPQRIFLLGKR